LVHAASAANELAAQHLNTWLAFTIAVLSVLSETLQPPSSPAPPAMDRNNINEVGGVANVFSF